MAKLKPQNPLTIPPEQEEFDGALWTLTPLGATKCGETFGELVELLGGPIGAIMQGGKPKSLAEAVEKVGPAIDALARSLARSGKMMPTIRTLLHDLKKGEEMVRVGANTEIFDYEFRGGQMSRLIPLVRWALEINFGDFYGALSKLGAEAESAGAGAESARPNGSAESRS